jgi:excisionase family DNA binding protein
MDDAIDDVSDEDLLDVDDLAERLKVGPRTIWRLESGGKIPKAVRFGGSTRWRRQEVNRWMADGCPKLAARENERRRK